MACGKINVVEGHDKHYCFSCGANVVAHECCDDVNYCMLGGECFWQQEDKKGALNEISAD